jgi:hypothetical protein
LMWEFYQFRGDVETFAGDAPAAPVETHPA